MFRRIFYVFIVGIFVLAMTVVPALASGNDLVINSGEEISGTMALSSSNTGDNVADGSYGGNGGDGGSIRAREVDKSSTGRGGNGGDSGIGGTVLTGDASSITDVTTEAGNSDTRINRCACDNETEDSGNSIVFNRTRSLSLTLAGAEANTGENEAMGSEAGSGGNGGDISSDSDHENFNKGEDEHGHNNDSSVDKSSTGIGGNGGASDAGGYIESGNSNSRTTVVNVLNRNITRILR